MLQYFLLNVIFSFILTFFADYSGFSSGDTGSASDDTDSITPFDDYDYTDPFDIGQIVYQSIDLLEQFSPGTHPVFSIISSEEYMFETLSNSSMRTQILPPYFLISLSYKPNNNTAVRLLSIQNNSLRTDINVSTPVPNNSPSSDTGILSTSSPTRSNTSFQSLSSIMLTSTVTYLHSGVFSDLWRMSNLQHHTITLMVSNGQLSSCLNDEFQPAVQSISLWNPSTSNGPLKVDLSSYLHSLASVVG